MPLIQDIVNPNSGKPAKSAVLQATSRAAVKQIKRIHNATKLINLTVEPVVRTYKSAGRYDKLRPHPLIHKPLTDISPVHSSARPLATAPKRPVVPPQPTPAPAKAEKSVKTINRARILDFLQYPVIAVVAVGAAYSSGFGQILIGLFFVIALLFKLSSRIAFICALLLLVSIPFFQILHQDSVSNNSAIYAFEMLCVGTVLALLESWKDGRNNNKDINLSSKKDNTKRLKRLAHEA